MLMNASDRNLVVNKVACFVKSEINDLHFVVHLTTYLSCKLESSETKKKPQEEA